MKLEGLSTGTLIEYMGATANVSKELSEFIAKLQADEQEGKFPVGSFSEELVELRAISNEYVFVHNEMHREFDSRMTKALKLKRGIVQLGAYVKKVLDKRLAFNVEQATAKKEGRVIKLDAKDSK